MTGVQTCALPIYLKFPTGPGAEGGEDRTTEDQFKEQLLDNLLNIGD